MLEAIITFVVLFLTVVMIVAYLVLRKELNDYGTKPRTYPFVSIVMPAYNEGERITLGIESALNQRYPRHKYEIIVVDDGSTDNTFEVAQRFVSKGVKVFRKSNGGAADAKNFGIKKAKGEIVITMDSDTVIEPDLINKVVCAFEHGFDALAVAVRVREVRNVLQWMQKIEYDAMVFSRKLLAEYGVLPILPGGCSAFKRDVLLRCGGFDTHSVAEDQEITFKIKRMGGKIGGLFNALALTDVPSTLAQLLKQRVRWLKGGLYNKVKHHSMFTFNDFTFFALTFDILFLTLFFNVVRFVFDSLSFFTSPLIYLNTFSLNDLLFLVDGITFASLLFLPLSLAWFVFNVKRVREQFGETLELWEVLLLPLYFTFFSVLYSVAHVIAIKEFLLQNREWGTR
jgi:cellulose synthase/poly-beta-1,6-N-acetylglucosamine synthase-like glycosyltransferase